LGHIRLGRLPRTRRWQQVVDLLDASTDGASSVARATLQAAEFRLRKLADDPSVSYCFWLLTRITQAARTDDFRTALAQIGLETREDESVLSFVSRVADVARHELVQHPESGHFAELAALALRRALTETVGQQGGSLFGSSVDDLQAALRAYSTDRSFGEVSRRFFGDFTARMLAAYVERELTNRIGEGPRLQTLTQSGEFMAGLDVHTRQAARIMEDFAAEWYSKRNWLTGGQISRDEAKGFTAVAFRKLRSELTRPDA
jgi:hypothetical protein